jgi:hypothetical protein
MSAGSLQLHSHVHTLIYIRGYVQSVCQVSKKVQTKAIPITGRGGL